MTVAMVKLSPLRIADGPWENPPGSIKVNGLRVDSPPVGWTDGEFKMCTVVFSGAQPTEFHSRGSDSLALNGNTLTVTVSWNAPGLPGVKSTLKDRLESAATQRWLVTRGAKAAQLETTLSNGKTAIDSAASVADAITAFNGVSWP